jgi:glyoxylase-like metal-dependent hydrolase (beta-lactamase superfamily II)
MNKTMKIAPGVYRLEHSRFSHIYYLSDEEVLIDTGLPFYPDAIIEELSALGKSVKAIFLTHHDVDHAGNVSRIAEAAGAVVYIGKDDAPFLLGEKHRPGRKRIFEILLRITPPVKCNTFSGQPRSRLGNIDVFHTPGHTPGHSVFLYKNILFSGDLFREKNGRVRGMSPAMNWDNDAARRSIAFLLSLDFDIACPGHGNPVQKETLLTQFTKGV